MPVKHREFVSNRRPSQREYERIHPVWRGVGFAMMILVPVIAYAAADVLLRQNGIHNWFPLPVDLIAHPGELLYRFFPDPMINIKAILFVVFVFILYAVFMLVSFIANSLFGFSPRNDPFYVPPVQRRRRRF